MIIILLTHIKLISISKNRELPNIHYGKDRRNNIHNNNGLLQDIWWQGYKH
jgi:hypothetical protein